MVVDYCRFNFSFGKFTPHSSHRMVYRLAAYFDFGWYSYVEKEKRRLLRLAYREKRRRETRIMNYVFHEADLILSGDLIDL